MKITYKIILFFLISAPIVSAQETKKLSLKEAIVLVTSQSKEVALSKLQTQASLLELQKMRDNQYPNLKISGEYLRLTNANASLKIPMSSSGNSQNGNGVSVSSLLLGQANVNMPVFAGFKLQNSISASKAMYEAEKLTAQQTKEQLALQVTKLFAQLYQTDQTIMLIAENIKSAQQREKDFDALMQNGLITKNDLLKVQLQVSNLQIALDTAQKNRNVLNYQLSKLLDLPQPTTIEINIDAVQKDMQESLLRANQSNRSDLEALQQQIKASEYAIKVAKSNYYPALALTGGYIAFDLQNVLRVSNAMNFGVGISYDVVSIFKNKKEVNLSKTKSEQLKVSSEILKNKIDEEIQAASENYNLSQKQNKVYQKSVEQSTENYRIINDKYTNGLANTTDLLDADVLQLQSKINLALSQADIALKYYELQFAQGNLLNSLNISK